MAFKSKLGFLIFIATGLVTTVHASNGGQEGHGGNHIISSFEDLLDQPFQKTDAVIEDARAFFDGKCHQISRDVSALELREHLSLATTKVSPKIFSFELGEKFKLVMTINTTGWLNLGDDAQAEMAAYVSGLVVQSCGANQRKCGEIETAIRLSHCVETRLSEIVENRFEMSFESEEQQTDLSDGYRNRFSTF